MAKSILATALETPVRIIASNSNQEGAVVLDQIKSNSSVNYGYDAVLNDYTDLVERGIIDPTKVSRSALENAASVASMILTTYSLITQEEEEHHDDHGHMH